MAGAENATHLGFLQKVKAENLLLSFFYMRNRWSQKIINYLELCKSFSKSIFLDSWAHTIIVAFWKDEKWGFKNNYTNIDLDWYIKWFLQFVALYHKYFDAIAELDIGIVDSVWYEKVKERRKYMVWLWLKNKMVVVCHFVHFAKMSLDWKQEWRNILNEYPMVALWDAPDWNILIEHFNIWKEVWKHNKIHWFAETKIKKLVSFPFYSVDSTSWLQGVRFNSFRMFNNWKQINFTAKQYREKYWVDFAKLTLYERLWICYKAYNNMEKYITALHKAKWIDYRN